MLILSPQVHASESQHWYTQRGEPAYEVLAKNGTPRPTTLRDARKYLLVPSVTTIIKEGSKPNLENWKQNQVLLAALTLPRNPGEPEADWIARVMLDSKETARKAAEKGTEIHKAIQGHYEGTAPSEEYLRHVQGAVKAVRDAYGDLAWIPEASFASPEGYGGKIDLHSPKGRIVVLDFKTKEFGPDDVATMKTWDDQAMQLAAYRHGKKLHGAETGICYVSVNHPGTAVVCPIEEEDLYRGWEMFEALLAYWQAKTKFDSSFKVAA